MLKKLLVREIPSGQVIELMGDKRTDISSLLVWNNNRVQSRVELKSSDLVSMKSWIEDRLKEIQK